MHDIFTGSSVLGEFAHNGRRARIQAERLLQAAVEEFQFGQILCGARPLRITKNGVQFLDQFLLSPFNSPVSRAFR